MPVGISQTRFDDFEALQDAVQDNKSDVMQLGAGRMTGLITHLEADLSFGISTGRFSQAMRMTGILSNSRWCLGYLLATDGSAFGFHQTFGAGDLAIAAPGEDRYITFRDNTEYFATMIDPQELQNFLAPSPGAYDSLLKHKLSILHAAPAAAKANVTNLRPLLDALIEQGPAMPDDAAAFYRRNILEQLTAPLCNMTHYRGAHLVSQDKLVRDIEYFLDQAGPRPVHVSELCEVFHVHPRKLHRAFQDVLGTPPISYLRKKRLNDVHTALRKGGLGVTIRNTATAHGFIELGRFADAYRRMFGELPSQTLKRNLIILMFGLALPFYCGFVTRNWLKLISISEMITC